MPDAPLTVAKPPQLDRTVAAVAGAISAILVGVRAAGYMPNVEIPPDVVVLIVTSVATLVASLRAWRESKASTATAELVTSLVAQVATLREAASAAAVTAVEPAPAAVVPMDVPVLRPR